MSRPQPTRAPSPAQVAEAAQQLAAGLAIVTQVTEPVLEAVEGYRARLERAGYPEALARKMAADYHARLLEVVIR